MNTSQHVERCHELAMDQINEVLITLQDDTIAPLKAEIDLLRQDKALLDWADAEGHHDARYGSLREELRDKGARMPIAGQTIDLAEVEAQLDEMEGNRAIIMPATGRVFRGATFIEDEVESADEVDLPDIDNQEPTA